MTGARAAQKAVPESPEQNQNRPGHTNPDKKITTLEDLKEYMRRRAQDRYKRLGGQEGNDSDKRDGVDRHKTVESPRSGEEQRKPTTMQPRKPTNTTE